MRERPRHPLEGKRGGVSKKKNRVQDPSFGQILETRPWMAESQLSVFLRDAKISPTALGDVVQRFRAVRDQIVQKCQVIDESFSFVQREEARLMMNVQPMTAETQMTPDERKRARDVAIRQILSNGGYPEGVGLFSKLAFIEERVEKLKASGRYADVGAHSSEVNDCFEKGLEVHRLLARAHQIYLTIEETRELIMSLQIKINSSPLRWPKRK